MKKTSILIAIAVAMVLGSLNGCANAPESNGERWVQAAPAGVNGTGYIVELGEGARAEVSKLLEAADGRARLLNSTRGLYEIYGVSSDLIKAALPLAEPRKNIYFDRLLDQAPLLPAVEVPFIADCRIETNSDLLPRFGVRALSNIAELSTSKIIRAAKSPVLFQIEGAALEYSWEVHGPRGLNLTGRTTEIAVPVSVPGLYLVSVTGKNAARACNQVMLQFAVTWDVPFLGNKLPRLATLEGVSAMGHLKAINAYDAWSKSKGAGVMIAVLDTGVNYNHPDLSPNIPMNQSELASDGDDDHNGFINDYVGWDFAMGDNMPFDDDGHGTHVAGLAAGAVYGVAPQAKILPVKVLNAAGGGDVASIEAGIYYAVDRGANIIVMSLGRGDAEFQAVLQPAINYAEQHNVLVVAAAGNASTDNDAKPIFPAAFHNANVLTVAATAFDGSLESYSNFGHATVHLGAPGGDLNQGQAGLWGPDFMDALNGGYVRMSGTSMAAPVTAGVAALVKSMNGMLGAVQIKGTLIRFGVPKPALQHATASARMVNAELAVNGAELEKVSALAGATRVARLLDLN